ncbi:hypothetical protein PR048_027075 [Dryococelus australis]|uniref:Zinc finger PHD-type domain-containing protein n=1 Tax=Dryococelus australis TaxID=614101 RepID=A0ABQ9GG31_9NEOP|nr:hypothetical protein PR048_027075 [Dryococelus australis]
MPYGQRHGQKCREQNAAFLATPQPTPERQEGRDRASQLTLGLLTGTEVRFCWDIVNFWINKTYQWNRLFGVGQAYHVWVKPTMATTSKKQEVKYGFVYLLVYEEPGVVLVYNSPGYLLEVLVQVNLHLNIGFRLLPTGSSGLMLVLSLLQPQASSLSRSLSMTPNDCVPSDRHVTHVAVSMWMSANHSTAVCPRLTPRCSSYLLPCPLGALEAHTAILERCAHHATIRCLALPCSRHGARATQPLPGCPNKSGGQHQLTAAMLNCKSPELTLCSLTKPFGYKMVGSVLCAGQGSRGAGDGISPEEDVKPVEKVHKKKTVEQLRRDELINCTCGYLEEDGLMIQCDLCLCWQHGVCNNIEKEEDVPDKYVCSICLNPPRARASKKYLHDQDWLKEGKLSSLSFRSKNPVAIAQREAILKRSHELTGMLLQLQQAIHSLRVKLSIAEATKVRDTGFVGSLKWWGLDGVFRFSFYPALVEGWLSLYTCRHKSRIDRSRFRTAMHLGRRCKLGLTRSAINVRNPGVSDPQEFDQAGVLMTGHGLGGFLLKLCPRSSGWAAVCRLLQDYPPRQAPARHHCCRYRAGSLRNSGPALGKHADRSTVEGQGNRETFFDTSLEMADSRSGSGGIRLVGIFSSVVELKPGQKPSRAELRSLQTGSQGGCHLPLPILSLMQAGGPATVSSPDMALPYILNFAAWLHSEGAPAVILCDPVRCSVLGRPEICQVLSTLQQLRRTMTTSHPTNSEHANTLVSTHSSYAGKVGRTGPLRCTKAPSSRDCSRGMCIFRRIFSPGEGTTRSREDRLTGPRLGTAWPIPGSGARNLLPGIVNTAWGNPTSIELRPRIETLASSASWKSSEKTDHPKLYLWAKNWEKGVKCEDVKPADVEDVKKLDKLDEVYPASEASVKTDVPDRSHEDGHVKEEEVTVKVEGEEEEDHKEDASLLHQALTSRGQDAMLQLPICQSELMRFASSMADKLQAEEPPRAPQPEAPIDPVECRLNLLDHINHSSQLVDSRLSSIAAQIAGNPTGMWCAADVVGVCSRLMADILLDHEPRVCYSQRWLLSADSIDQGAEAEIGSQYRLLLEALAALLDFLWTSPFWVYSRGKALESQDPDFAKDETPDFFPKTKQTVQMLMRDLFTMEKIAALYDEPGRKDGPVKEGFEVFDFASRTTRCLVFGEPILREECCWLRILHPPPLFDPQRTLHDIRRVAVIFR